MNSAFQLEQGFFLTTIQLEQYFGLFNQPAEQALDQQVMMYHRVFHCEEDLLTQIEKIPEL